MVKFVGSPSAAYMPHPASDTASYFVILNVVGHHQMSFSHQNLNHNHLTAVTVAACGRYQIQFDHQTTS